MKPLQVAIDARIESGMHGGVEQVVIGLVSALSRLQDGDEAFHVLVRPDSTDWIVPYVSGPCRLLPGRRTNDSPGLYNLIRRFPGAHLLEYVGGWPGRLSIRVPESDGTIEAAGIDLMHFTFQSAFLTKVPSIYQPHDLQHLHLPRFFKPRNRVAREVLYRTFCRQARKVVVGSQWVRRDVMEHYGIAPEKILVVNHAPYTAPYAEPSADDLEAVRRQYGLPKTFVLYPAQTFPHKNHLGLIDAIARLRDREGLTVPLVCSGTKNDFYPRIEQRIRARRLEGLVFFPGFVSPLELQCLFRMARAVVIPTLFEAASGPMAEAFFAGVPTASSNVTSLPEQAGDAALLFDPRDTDAIADAVRRLWTDAALRETLVARGRESIARLTWEKTARHFRALYRQITGRGLTDADREILAAPSLL